MLGKSLFLTALAAIQAVSAQNEYLGFNYGATKANGQIKVYEDFKEEFELAQKLPGAAGKFTSARLYTMIQGPSKDDPISAFQAAIDTKTSILLGIWCSAGPEIVANEISALTKAIKQYGSKFTDLVVGLSVGSEDLYRNSVMGIQNESGIGAQPAQLVEYINQVKSALSGTALNKVPIGHVDTWTVWVNGTNNPVIEAVDWIGFDAYPYFQSTMANDITDAAALFWDAYQQTQKATGKEVWITETGWPVAGKVRNLAKAGADNAQTYWNEIGCAIFGNYKTWWYMLRDADPTPPETEFGVLDTNLKPYYDLSCKNAKPVSSPVAAPATTAAPTTRTGSTQTPGSTFAVEPTRATSASTSSGTNSPQTTDAPNSGVVLHAAMGFVALQAVVAAFFLL
jgi:glucan endo-1,3-beta-D-glucosidase